MRYFAEIGPGNIVLRVIVASDLAWCAETLGGFWVETYQEVPGERYASMGMVYAAGDARKFLYPNEVE
jgi:hypothetical protein